MANFCTKCGAEIPVGEGFCPKCGNMVSIAGNAAPQTFQPQMNAASNANVRNGEKKKQSVIGIVAGILGIVSLLLSTVGIGFLVGIAAVILGVIGITKKHEYGIGMAVTGIITGGLAMLIGLMVIVGAAISGAYVSGYNSGYDVPWYEKW